jgi:hypothetical protein
VHRLGRWRGDQRGVERLVLGPFALRLTTGPIGDTRTANTTAGLLATMGRPAAWRPNGLLLPGPGR